MLGKQIKTSPSLKVREGLGVSYACVVMLLVTIFTPPQAIAIIDPLAVPNNRIGVHILDTPEIGEAAKLVNSSGGDWGYVTIPVRSNDRDTDKWTKFMLDAKKLHVIPLLRIATFPQEGIWATPTVFDLVDFVNFFDQLPWPTKNRYIILFNEPNHASEWGGEVSPAEYATLLIDADRIFKSHSQDYFLISAGLDMSAPNSKTSLDALEFYRRMTTIQPQWYQSIDGISVHAYPNPGFSSFPWTLSRYGINSYRYELAYLNSLKLSRSPALPLFITETGWINDLGSLYYKTAFNTYWSDPNIIAITPFILFAGSNDFSKFSLLTPSIQPTGSYQEIFKYPKIAGSPLLENIYITNPVSSSSNSGFSPAILPPVSIIESVQIFLKRLFNISKSTHTLDIGSQSLEVEIADTDRSRTQGLSGRTSLPSNTGMLFIFSDSAHHTFWMKDMKFDIDFIWINKNKVVQINDLIPSPDKTSGTPQVISPDIDINMVLEVPAGFVQQNHIENGDKIKLW